jgi:hypothetical protein
VRVRITGYGAYNHLEEDRRKKAGGRSSRSRKDALVRLWSADTQSAWTTRSGDNDVIRLALGECLLLAGLLKD